MATTQENISPRDLQRQVGGDQRQVRRGEPEANSGVCRDGDQGTACQRAAAHVGSLDSKHGGLAASRQAHRRGVPERSTLCTDS